MTNQSDRPGQIGTAADHKEETLPMTVIHTTNPSGVHCPNCSVHAPCGPCQAQIDAETAWTSGRTYTPDPLCRIACEGHICRNGKGQILTGDNGDCHTGARLQIRLESTADRMIAEACQRVAADRSAADQEAREADARLRCYLEQQLTWIRPIFVQRRLRDLLHSADHAALIAEGWDPA